MTRLLPMSQAQLSAMGIQSPERAAKAARKQVKGQTISGGVAAPAYEVSAAFDLQSYFDDTLSERALFRQNPNEPIVKSTISEPIQVAGYGLALHPDSETPIAVQFMTGAQQGASQTYHIKPGQVIRPQGRGVNGEPGFFTGFQWGLPFGWLGGGSATLVVLRSPDALVHWGSDEVELIFHRIRLKIWNPADVLFPAAGGLYTGPLNWPLRFPWPAAMFGPSSLTQRGQPALAVFPTRTAFSLRLASVVLAAPPGDGTWRMNWVGTDDWAQGGPPATGNHAAISLADVRGTDQIWGTWAQQAGAPAPFNSVFQTLVLRDEPALYAANAGALLLSSLDPQLQNQFVDIVRYAEL